MKIITAKKEQYDHLTIDNDSISTIITKIEHTKSEFKKIKQGVHPIEFGDRYITYYEDEKLFIHYTNGICIYSLKYNLERRSTPTCVEITRYGIRSEEPEEFTINYVTNFLSY